MSTDGDKDGDGFIEYARQSAHGLLHQSWKDSDDSLFHEDGSSISGPFAVCEVQGYVYAAFCAGAEIAMVLGYKDHSIAWTDKAKALQENFNKHFWCETANYYGMALDGFKKLCCVEASNSGQLLFSGIVPKNRIESIANTLMTPEFFSGWGVRTLSSKSVRFNPISYHNGSIWPHDNALIAYGLGLCGQKDAANKIFAAMFDAATRTPLHRLPELFCGFTREQGYGPMPYPVACSPQAWASGAICLLLQSSLGIQIDASTRSITLDNPSLPAFLDEIQIKKLPLLDASVDLHIRRHNCVTEVTIENNPAGISLVVKN
jgi:glycogen debranching enzyme